MRDDFSKYLPQRKYRSDNKWIAMADEAIDIRELYNEVSKWKAPSGEYSSWKIYCPFAFEHPDGGLDKNCRLYPPTHIYCWESSLHGFITPSSLYARWKGIPRERAAITLLEERGLLKTKNYREKWSDLLAERDAKAHAKLGNKSDAVSALHAALAGDSVYESAEYADEVRKAWVVVLEKLDLIWQYPEADLTVLEQWFSRSLSRIQTAALTASAKD